MPIKQPKTLRIAALTLLSSVLATSATLLNTVNANGYAFNNFDFPNSGNNAGAGTNVNAVANNGTAVGFSIDNDGNFSNFTRSGTGAVTRVNFTGTNSMAFGVNSSGYVVGQQNGQAVIQSPNGTVTQLPVGGTNSTAFGINDSGSIVGQYMTANATPGFILSTANAGPGITINAPSGPNTVNAQAINNSGLIAGFYVGTDGQDHGFFSTASLAKNGVAPSFAVADPRIPGVPGEPGATFVFSQILGVNDKSIAVGYYGDSTTSQHGFIYDVLTGQYTFLDDPSEAFHNGVEVTQITGITDSGELSGFYSDANGAFHGFVACPGGVCASTSVTSTPEPASLGLAMLGAGLVATRFVFRRRKHGQV